MFLCTGLNPNKDFSSRDSELPEQAVDSDLDMDSVQVLDNYDTLEVVHGSDVEIVLPNVDVMNAAGRSSWLTGTQYSRAVEHDLG